jgi:hypothetical protein
MRITLLPNEVRVDLSEVDAALWGGIVAVVRPLDVEELMRWVDSFPGEDTRREAAVVLVKRQLVNIEGPVDFEGAAYDPKDVVHFKSLFSAARKGPAAIMQIYTELVDRSRLDGEAEKNSSSPSDSGTTSSSEG